MLLQSAALLATKFVVYYKITACTKQIYLLGVTCRVSDRKALSKENVSFVGNVCLLSIFNFVPRVTHVLLRAADWLTTNFLGM